MKKRFHFSSFVSGVFTSLLVVGLAISALAAYTQSIEVQYSDIKLTIDGVTVTPKDATGATVEPFIYQGTTYLPVRAVGEAIGYDVGWDDATQTVSLSKGTTTTEQTATSVNMIDTMEPYSYSSSIRVETYPTKESGGIYAYLYMGDNSYQNALELTQNNTTKDNTQASFNLGGTYSTLSGLLGLVDGSEPDEDVTVWFYGDGTLLETFTVSPGTLPVNFSVDVTSVSALRIELNGSYEYTSIGLANLVLS